MKERPIIFSGPMVRAIRENRKKQTRRVMRALLPGDRNYINAASHDEWISRRLEQCPYGKPGDRLWVRETWVPTIPGSWRPLERGEKMSVLYAYDPRYRADYPYGMDDYDGKWRPSIHMPRKFSRITLEITDVRVERVQDISEADAIAEGIQVFGATPTEILSGLMASMGPVSRRAFLASALAIVLGVADVITGRRTLTNREAYAILWDKINAKRGYGWDLNPWVWVLEFEEVRC